MEKTIKNAVTLHSMIQKGCSRESFDKIVQVLFEGCSWGTEGENDDRIDGANVNIVYDDKLYDMNFKFGSRDIRLTDFDAEYDEDEGNPLVKLEIDVVLDEPLDFLELLARYELSISILERIGPAGGNPLCELHGRRDNVVRFMRESYLADDPSEWEELYEMHVTVVGN